MGIHERQLTANSGSFGVTLLMNFLTAGVLLEAAVGVVLLEDLERQELAP